MSHQHANHVSHNLELEVGSQSAPVRLSSTVWFFDNVRNDDPGIAGPLFEIFCSLLTSGDVLP